MLKAQVNQEMINILETALERVRLQPLGLDELIRKQLGREYSHNYVDAISKGKTKSIPADAWDKIIERFTAECSNANYHAVA
ncbi:MAG: hypothetical protein ACI9SP_004376 [Arenicella sp.]|jgi:hypothetical protein